VVLDLFNQGFLSLKEYHKALSDFAKDMVHGRPAY